MKMQILKGDCLELDEKYFKIAQKRIAEKMP